MSSSTSAGVRGAWRRAARSRNTWAYQRSLSIAVALTAARCAMQPMIARDDGQPSRGRIGHDQFLDQGVGIVVGAGETNGQALILKLPRQACAAHSVASKTTVECARTSGGNEVDEKIEQGLPGAFEAPGPEAGPHQIWPRGSGCNRRSTGPSQHPGGVAASASSRSGPTDFTLPPTITVSARPFSFQPMKGEFCSSIGSRRGRRSSGHGIDDRHVGIGPIARCLC